MSKTLQYITDEHGERTAVVLPILQYEKLLEDLDDLAAVADAERSQWFHMTNMSRI